MSRISIAVAAAVLTAAGLTTAALATNSDAGTPAARSHVQRFHAHATAQLATTKTTFVLAERDVTGHKVIGHDVLYCRSTRTHSNCQIALAQQGGLIYAHFLLRDSDHSIRGTITGGTGHYRGARGTITGQVQSQSDVRVVLRYQN
jgi:hypothetical protein